MGIANQLAAPVEFSPFDYQDEAIDTLFQLWKDNPGFWYLLVMATGAGKTIVFSFLMKRLLSEYPHLKVLFLAHRKELVGQSEDKLLSVWPQAPCGVYAAALNRREIQPITIASRDTLAPFLEKIPGYRPDLIIVDEAHNISHKETTRYRMMLTEFERRNPELMLLGLTATPFRQNHGAIYGSGEIFDAIAYNISIRTLIDKGRLAPLVTKQVKKEAIVDTSKIKIVNGDFQQKALAEATNQISLIDATIQEWKKLAWDTGRKSTLFFCVSVAHAEAVQTALSLLGFHFPLVTGTTASSVRERIGKEFQAGKHNGLINVGVFTEGTDFPIIDCISNLRAVHSLGLWIQMAGRGMRIHPNPDVTDCLVLDFGGCVERFGEIDIAQPPAKRGKPDDRTKVCPDCKTIVGHLKRKCFVCEYEFSPPPHKLCEICSTENPPSAGSCIACGHLFAKHSIVASDGDILSSPDKYRVFAVTGALSCRSLIGKSSGQAYMQVIYPVANGKQFSKNLFIGYNGAVGYKSQIEWQNITVPGTPTPETVEEACRLTSESSDVTPLFKSDVMASNVFKRVESITIDWQSKYKDIKSIKYMETEQ